MGEKLLKQFKCLNDWAFSSWRPVSPPGPSRMYGQIGRLGKHDHMRKAFKPTGQRTGSGLLASLIVCTTCYPEFRSSCFLPFCTGFAPQEETTCSCRFTRTYSLPQEPTIVHPNAIKNARRVYYTTRCAHFGASSFWGRGDKIGLPDHTVRCCQVKQPGLLRFCTSNRTRFALCTHT